MDGDDKYKLFNLKSKEFMYTVDDSNPGCGYVVAMDEDGGKSKHGQAGAKYGPHELKFINGEARGEGWVPSETDVNAGTGRYGSCCTEIDSLGSR